MRRKEALYAVIGGVVGAILTMVVGSFSPLGAQSQSDVSFGKITCKELAVENPDGAVWIFPRPEDGGVDVYGKDGKIMASISVIGNGGFVGVYGKDGSTAANMFIGEHGGQVAVYGGDRKSAAVMVISEVDGGMVGVSDNNGVSTVLD